MDRIAQIHEKWNADRGTQLVFLDRSVPKAKGDDKIVAAYDALRGRLDKAQAADDEREQQSALDALEAYNPNEVELLRAALNGGWNAYDEIKRQLIAKGIPESEIRFVQEAANDSQKDRLFEQVRSGEVRVLIGSTPRMGAGTNVQNRLVALHHVDVTWKPSDIEQREGRIVRQGNELLQKYGQNFAVDIVAYATERTVDAKMWSLNATKLRSINGIRKYDGAFEMEFEDQEIGFHGGNGGDGHWQPADGRACRPLRRSRNWNFRSGPSRGAPTACASSLNRISAASKTRRASIREDDQLRGCHRYRQKRHRGAFRCQIHHR